MSEAVVWAKTFKNCIKLEW